MNHRRWKGGPSDIPGISIPGLERLFEIYDDLDRRVDLFKRQSGLECLKGCQACCRTAKFVEASIFEMLPLALLFWREGKAQRLLARLEGIHPEDRCVLLRPVPSGEGPGGCGYYSYRPLICRLFGFTAAVNKKGEAAITLCGPLKEAHPGAEARANRGEGFAAPLRTEFSRKVAHIHPRLGKEKYPINLALREALELIGERRKPKAVPDGRGGEHGSRRS